MLYAGKSTLLNALLGAICLPSSNVPETARITRITHTPLKDGKQPELTYQPSGSHEQRTIVGEYGIRKFVCFFIMRAVQTACRKYPHTCCLASYLAAKHAQKPWQKICRVRVGCHICSIIV